MTTTVKPRYFELGLFEVPAISKEDRIPLDLPLSLRFPAYFETPLFQIFFPFPLGLRNSGVRL